MNTAGFSTMVPRWSPNDVPDREMVGEALRCPFESNLNPVGNAAQERSSRWLERMYGDSPAVRRTVRSRMSWIVAGFYPTTDLERLCIATDYICWAFLLDDLGDETPAGQRPAQLAALFDRFDEVFRGVAIPAVSDVSVRALRDIVERLSRVATPGQLEAFFDANRAYFGGMLWEANNRAESYVPDEEAFLLLRPAAGAVPPFFGLIEPLESITLDAEVKSHPSVEALTTLAGRIVCWINDALSYEKERRLGDVHNLAIVYEVRRLLPPGAALSAAVAFSNSEVDEFMHLAATLPSFGSAQDKELGRYVQALGSVMRTTLDWTLGSARYAGIAGSQGRKTATAS
jgi:hypothetical protein